MKYMTPDLLARFRSRDDSVSEIAGAEWDRQCEAYIKHLEEIHPHLSRGARRLLRYNFHDARVLAIVADKGSHFSFLLELDPSTPREDKKRLELRYRLVGGAQTGYDIRRHEAEALVGDGKPLGWWLYDEWDVSRGDVPAMTHSILFTGGYEIRLTFFGVRCRRLDVLSFPLRENGLIGPKVTGEEIPTTSPLE